MISDDDEIRPKQTRYWKNFPSQPHLAPADYAFYLKRHLKVKDAQQQSPSLATIPKLSEIIQKLKEDLKASKGFVEEFVSEPQDGAGWLLELLRNVVNQSTPNGAFLDPRSPAPHQRNLRRFQADEFELLTCLSLTTSSERALKRMVEHSSGLCTIAACILSTQSKSRILALELLTKACDVAPHGYAKVLEAMSTVRVVFGESVRFRILVSLLHGNGTTSGIDFEYAALFFINTILKKCPRPEHRVRVQCEMEEAGFDITALETKLRERGAAPDHAVWGEVTRWKDNYLDVQKTLQQKRSLEEDYRSLQREVDMLRKALKKLEEDKISLMQIERELQERCDELEIEVKQYRKTREEKDFQKGSLKKKNEPSPPASDSGTYSLMHLDDQVFEENEQVENEEIWIDIPTIRPPEGFRSNLDEPEQDKQLHKEINIPSSVPPKNASGSDRDSALSESDSSDGNVDSGPAPWQYPQEENKARSRSVERGNSFHLTGVSSRSKSEDRRKELIDQEKEMKITSLSSSGEFHMKAPNKIRSPSKESLHSSHPLTDSLPLRLSAEKSPHSLPPSSKHFPLPRTCKGNFILRGHGNCGRYSGPPQMIVPPPDYRQDYVKDPVSALVHREIAEAVREIGGWL